jgi:hypothetical protein
VHPRLLPLLGRAWVLGGWVGLEGAGTRVSELAFTDGASFFLLRSPFAGFPGLYRFLWWICHRAHLPVHSP